MTCPDLAKAPAGELTAVGLQTLTTASAQDAAPSSPRTAPDPALVCPSRGRFAVFLSAVRVRAVLAVIVTSLGAACCFPPNGPPQAALRHRRQRATRWPSPTASRS